MKPLFHPHLVNKATGDPALYIDFLFERRAILFDLGDISALSPKKLLRLTDIFISHTHMDHFYGFDHLLRILLGREKYIRIFGPPGIIENISGKLRGYTWNLVANYKSNLSFEVTEIHNDHLMRSVFHCKKGFRLPRSFEKIPKEEFLLDALSFQIKSVCLDHGTPCLAFCLKEKKHLNVNKVKLEEMNLPVGPWLKELKEAVRAGKPADSSIILPTGPKPLSYLKPILTVSEGQKIVYVVDSIYNAHTREKILTLAKGADYFFCEAAFLQKDGLRAAQRYHLTAHQAGMLARDAGVKTLIAFHYSPRYHGSYHLIVEEALAAFRGS